MIEKSNMENSRLNKKCFSSSIFREIRTKLNVIVGFFEYIKSVNSLKNQKKIFDLSNFVKIFKDLNLIYIKLPIIWYFFLFVI